MCVAAALAASLSAPAVGAQPGTADDASLTVASQPVSSPARAEKASTVSVLYATTAQQGSLAAVKGKKRTYVMTLRGASDHVTWFTDRPARQSGFLPTAGFASSWAGYGFAQDPPNVALVVRDRSGATDTVVAVMSGPKVTAKGVFTAQLRVLSVDQAQQVGGNLAVHAGRHDAKIPSRFTSAALFIDDVNGTTIKGCLIQAYTYCAYADLRGADLSGADLNNADLNSAYLYGANLSGANLQYAYLGEVFLANANLSGASLNNAFLYRADLSGADLSGANLSGANLVSVYLTGANLSGSLTDSRTTCPNGNNGPCW